MATQGSRNPKRKRSFLGDRPAESLKYGRFHVTLGTGQARAEDFKTGVALTFIRARSEEFFFNAAPKFLRRQTKFSTYRFGAKAKVGQ